MVAATYGNEASPATASRAFCCGDRAVDLLCFLADQFVQLTGGGSVTRKMTMNTFVMFL